MITFSDGYLTFSGIELCTHVTLIAVSFKMQVKFFVSPNAAVMFVGPSIIIGISFLFSVNKSSTNYIKINSHLKNEKSIAWKDRNDYNNFVVCYLWKMIIKIYQ